MPYIVCRCDKTKDECLSNDLLLDGYKLPSRNKSFIIGDMLVINIVIMNKKLAHRFASRAAFKKYNRLINELTELFIEDGDSSSGMNEVLNRIEKFREEIKIKYRKYLKRKGLEQMATHLQFLKKQASEQQMLFFYSKQNKMHDENKTSGKSR